MNVFQSPGEVLFTIGNWQIHWYGVIMAIAFLAGLKISTIMAKYNTKADDYSAEHIINLATILLMGGIICARLYFVVFNWEYFALHPDEIFMTWRGGLSIHGAIIGGIIFIFIYTQINGLSFFRYTDLFAYGLVLAQAIGRWGNYFNSEAFGPPTDLPWKIYIAPEYRPIDYIDYEYFHPTFLYESVWALIVFFILTLFVRRKFGFHYGIVTFSYLILYSAGRIFLENYRIDNIFTIAGMHLPQFTSIVLLGLGVFGLLLFYTSDIFLAKLQKKYHRKKAVKKAKDSGYSKEFRDMMKKI